MNRAPHIRADVAGFRFQIRGLESDLLRVATLEGVEALSQLFRFRIGLVSEDDAIVAADVLGRPALLELDGERGTRTLHGIIRRFERVGQGGRLTHYSARLVPPHWILTKRIQSRVFNEKRCRRMDVIGIVAKVFADAGLPETALTTVGLGEYESREITVQYRESDWAFVSRLLEAEGIYYHFDHSADECRMVLVDSKGARPGFDSSELEVPFRDERHLVADREFVHAARRCARVRSGAVSLDDFDFKDPARELRLDQTGSVFTGLQQVDFPGGYVDPARGRRLVRTRFEAEQVRADEFRFRASVRAFQVGGRFRLIDHPNTALNAEYLVTHLRHRATQPQSGQAEVSGGDDSRYEAVLRAMPAETQFRPPRITPCPRVAGSQTAIVVGPPGEEIHTDEYGRVEVRFHWDQDGPHAVGASCWIRVSQGWAGGQYGTIFLPRIGQEVIVDFLEGDPDQPIITGRVYNKDHLPPYTLPDQKTISSIRTCSSPGAMGGNEMRFDDKKGSEQLLLFAQNALHTRTQGNRFENVGGDSHETIRGDAFELVQKNKHSTVKLDHIEEVNGSKQLTVGGDVRDWLWGKKETIVHGRYLLQNRDGGIVLHSAKSITLFAAGNFIKIDESGVSIVGKLVKINSGDSVPYWGDYADGLPVKLPTPADTTQFGHNVRYAQAGLRSDGQPPEEIRQATSWIEIELIDEVGRPVSGEAYEIILPDGKKIGGMLDQAGRAHVAVPDPGACQITFPRLDAAAWEPAG